MFLGYIFLFFSKIYFFLTSIGHERNLPPEPYIKMTDEVINEGFKDIYKILIKNLKAPAGKINDEWAIPSGIFGSCYLWDSAFISQVWKYWDVETAGRILRPLFNNQEEDGRIPHYVSPFGKSKLTQPPLLAWAISNLNISADYLKDIYPILKNFNQWLYKHRQLDTGLFYWQHSYESGIDNSPRFTDRSEKTQVDTTKIAAVDLNTYMIMQNAALIQIAQRLEKEKSRDHDYKLDIQEFEGKISLLKDKFQEYLWDEGFGLYFDYDFEKNERIEMNTIVSLLPLITEIPNEHQATLILKHVENPHEYKTKIPLPTVARNDKNFEKDMWRGPVWVNLAYLIIKGLETRQLFKLSGDLSYKLIKGVHETRKNEGSYYEFYDPDRFDLKELSRKKGNLYKRVTLGKKPVKKFVGWTGLINSLLIESVIGFSINEKTIQPRLPEELLGKNIVIGFPSNSLELEISYSSDKIITIRVSDLKGKKEDLIKECSMYQKISIAEFFN